MRFARSVAALFVLSGLVAGCPHTSSGPDVVAAGPDADAVAPVTDAPATEGGACTDTPANVIITPINTVPAAGTAPAVTAYHVIYVSTGGLHIHGQLCVPSSPGPHPIVVFNHGGIAGLGPTEWGATGGASGNQCYNLAAAGFIASMTQYRGEGDTIGGALGTLTSEGSLEFCAGEVDDSLVLLGIAQQRCDADPTRVAVYGISHGGCITLESLRRNVPGVRAGVAIVPPTDIGPLYDYHLVHAPGGDGGTDACDPTAVHQYLISAITGAIGTPASNPSAYAARSVANNAGDFAHVPVMILWGADDCTVPISQACTFQAAASAAGVTSVNYHLDTSGAATTAPIAACPGFMPLSSSPWPGTTGFTADRYFVVLDGQGHGFTGVGLTLTLNALSGFLTAHLGS